MRSDLAPPPQDRAAGVRSPERAGVRPGHRRRGPRTYRDVARRRDDRTGRCYAHVDDGRGRPGVVRYAPRERRRARRPGHDPSAGHRANPEGFDPRRFPPEHSDARPKYAYLPFGGGRRICVGAGSAQLEATLVLASIAQTQRLDLVPGTSLRPRAGVTMHPRGRIPMVVSSRGDQLCGQSQDKNTRKRINTLIRNVRRTRRREPVLGPVVM